MLLHSQQCYDRYPARLLRGLDAKKSLGVSGLRPKHHGVSAAKKGLGPPRSVTQKGFRARDETRGFSEAGAPHGLLFAFEGSYYFGFVYLNSLKLRYDETKAPQESSNCWWKHLRSVSCSVL